MSSILVLPDIHFPYHDKKAWALTRRVIAKCKPDRVIQIGDGADFYSVSSFPKDPSRKAKLKDEIDAVNAEYDLLDHDNVVLLGGNHEYRLQRYLQDKAPALFGMVECSKLLRVQERGWRWVPYMQHLIVGKVLFCHDLGHSGKNAALNTLGSAGHCVVFGHTHRGGVHYGGTVGGDSHFALNVGWLGDSAQVDYMHKAKTRDWQLGFGWINMDSKGRAWAQFCPIVRGRVCVDGTWVV